MFRVGIVGPESTGKSELAAFLAAHFQTGWVKEYARSYLEEKSGKYDQSDLINIANGQQMSVDQVADLKFPVYFFDTTHLVIKIWNQFVFNHLEKTISDLYQNEKYDLYLLTNIDLPWKTDPLREHPQHRQLLFNLYKEALEVKGKPFEIISGLGKQRFESALKAFSAFNF